jgi:hypothetical protein
MRVFRLCLLALMLLATLGNFSPVQATGGLIWDFWEPQISNPHSSSCDTAVTHKEKLAVSPSTNLVLTATVNASRITVTSATLKYALNRGSIQTVGGVKSGSNWNFTVQSSSLPEGTQIDYAFLLSGSFIDINCLAYSVAVAPNAHGYESLATVDTSRDNAKLFSVMSNAFASMVDQPGYGVQTSVTKSTICAAFFVSPTPCALYPLAEVNTPLEQFTVGTPTIAMAQTTGSTVCVLDDDGYYFAFENSNDRSDDFGYGVTYYNEDSLNNAVLVGSGSHQMAGKGSGFQDLAHSSSKGGARSGFKFPITWTPAATVHVQEELSWNARGESWAGALRGVPPFQPFAGHATGEAIAPYVDSGWADFTPDPPTNTPNGRSWTGSGAGPVNAPNLSPFGAEDGPYDENPGSPPKIVWQVALTSGHIYAFYARLWVETKAEAESINKADAYSVFDEPTNNPPFRLQTPSLTLRILDPGWSFTTCQG